MWAGFGRVYCGCYYSSVVAIYWNLLIVVFRSVYGILNLSGVRSKADLVDESALSFPLTPLWHGIEHIIISLLFDIESNLLNSLIIREFSSFWLLNDGKMESESENMIIVFCLLFEMMSRARSIARAERIELFVGRAFLIIVLFKTGEQAVLLLSLEPSVKTYRWFLVQVGLALCCVEVFRFWYTFCRPPALHLDKQVSVSDFLHVFQCSPC